MFRNREKGLVFTAIIAFALLFSNGCCCDDIIEKILEKYDYVKGIKCRSAGKVKGCITIQEQGHLEIIIGFLQELL